MDDFFISFHTSDNSGRYLWKKQSYLTTFDCTHHCSVMDDKAHIYEERCNLDFFRVILVSTTKALLSIYFNIPSQIRGL